ncbi:MAG: hypothetical protein AAB929_05490 [Patescibacteria group bacterium]
MYNWSVDTQFLSLYPYKYKLWKLEQLINFGLGKEKINRKDLRENIDKIDIDPIKRKYLRFLLSNT